MDLRPGAPHAPLLKCGKHTREARSPPRLLQTEPDRRALEPGPSGKARQLFPKPSDPRPPCCVLEGVLPDLAPFHRADRNAAPHESQVGNQVQGRGRVSALSPPPPEVSHL